MEYTKGEWRITIHGLTSKIMAGKYLVAEGIYRKDNARVIAAAPEMYEALKEATAFILEQRVVTQMGEIVGKARLAIAKAEGK